MDSLFCVYTSSLVMIPDMVHFMCKSTAATARDDLEASVRLLYNIQDDSGKYMTIFRTIKDPISSLRLQSIRATCLVVSLLQLGLV